VGDAVVESHATLSGKLDEEVLEIWTGSAGRFYSTGHPRLVVYVGNRADVVLLDRIVHERHSHAIDKSVEFFEDVV
jgi:hypothetical protein